MNIPSFITNFKMPEWFIHIITGLDGETTDISRVLLLLAVLFFLGYAGYDVYHNLKFDHIGFGTGISAILAGGGAGIKIKETTEPGAPQ